MKRDRGGYTKNYRDKEQLFGFAIWLRNAKLGKTAKNKTALKLCKIEVDKALKKFS